jgi:hypothetical protein
MTSLTLDIGDTAPVRCSCRTRRRANTSNPSCPRSFSTALVRGQGRRYRHVAYRTRPAPHARRGDRQTSSSPSPAQMARTTRYQVPLRAGSAGQLTDPLAGDSSASTIRDLVMSGAALEGDGVRLAPLRAAGDHDCDGAPRPLGAEQSNTSVIFGQCLHPQALSASSRTAPTRMWSSPPGSPGPAASPMLLPFRVSASPGSRPRRRCARTPGVRAERWRRLVVGARTRA